MSDNKFTACFTKALPVPQRVLQASFCFCLVSMSFAMRLLISITILEMNELSSNFTQDPTFDYCWENSCVHDSEVKGHEHQFDWDEKKIGFVIAIFSIGYCIVQIPAGVLVDLFSAKMLWVCGLFLASVLTCFTPKLVQMDHGFLLILLTRAGIGLFEGPILISINSMLRKWFPADEVWLASGLVYSGIPFGGLISTLLGGLIMYMKNKWSAVFIIFGIAGMLLSIILFLCIYGTPEKHPCLSQNEKEYLNINATCPEISFSEIPWRAILSNSSVVGLVVARSGQEFGFNILMNYLPKYFAEVLCMDLIETVFYTAIPFFCAFSVCIFSTLLGDYLHKHDVSPTSIRKIFSGLSSIMPALFLVGTSFFNCQQFGVLFTFALTMCGMGFYLSGICTNELALSRIFCGTLSGVSNTGSGLTAIFGPLVIGYIVKTHSLNEWRITMWIIFIILNASTLPYMVWGSGIDNKFETEVASLTTEEIARRVAEQVTRKQHCIFL